MTTPSQSLAITTLHVLDQEEALSFYRDKIGFQVTNDLDLGFMRWLTIALPGDPRHEVLLSVPGAPMHDDTTAATVRDLITKGALGGLFLETDDVDATYAAYQAAGVDVDPEVTDQPYGRDFGARDPFGNSLRVSQRNRANQTEIQASYDQASTG